MAISVTETGSRHRSAATRANALKLGGLASDPARPFGEALCSILEVGKLELKSNGQNSGQAGVASFPVTLGTLLAVWSVKVLLSMNGTGS